MVEITKCLLLGAILLMLIYIRIGMEQWGAEIAFTKVTEVHHHYQYDVQSYGTISLNDELVGLNYK